MSGFVRINLGLLYPPFAQRLLELQTRCAARGVHYYITSGFRDEAEQNKLYAQGRTTPGPIVTNSRYGKSFHNFGIAADFTHDGDLQKSGLQPDWKPESYKVLGEEAGALGLEWGGNWQFKDLPHVQWPLPPGLTLKDLLTAYQRGGLPSAWKLLDLANG